MVTQSATSSSIASVPLKVGDNKTLDAWVHENKEGSDVIFNRTHWPGDCQGSLVRVTLVGGQDTAGFLFFVPRDVPSVKDKLQVRIFMNDSEHCVNCLYPARYLCLETLQKYMIFVVVNPKSSLPK